jgi:hypothetical protein
VEKITPNATRSKSKTQDTKMYPNEKASQQDLPQKTPPPPKDNGKGPLPSYTAATASASSSQAFQTRFASVSMHMEDRLRFLHFPDETFNICRQVVHTAWKRGIQDEREYGGSMEIKLYGHPWRGAGDESVDARRLICAILGALHGQGWVLTLSTDISKKNWDKDTLLFRHQVPSPAECEWCCIGFSKTDRIKFIDSKLCSFFTISLVRQIRIDLGGQTSNIGEGAIGSSQPYKALPYLPTRPLHLLIDTCVERGSILTTFSIAGGIHESNYQAGIA